MSKEWWFGQDLGHSGGWSTHHLHRVGFLSVDSRGAFEFINPFDIICGVHVGMCVCVDTGLL